MMRPFPAFGRALFWLGILLCLAQACGAYSVLTHEQIVDLLWDVQIRPMLKARFPQMAEKDFKEAHAYAYGGCLVQDMGYYPFGNKYFSDLTHYVRTGDFVAGLIQEANTPDEYAFALGALAHYVADTRGHPAINTAVAMEFPSLQKKYGNAVTYEDSPKAHIRAEFGFDMTEVAKNEYTSDTFHDFIGFNVSKELLERVFPKVYGVEFQDVIHDEDMAIGTFRRAISQVIPEMTRVALLTRRKDIGKDAPSAAKRKYRYYLSRAKYETEWGTKYRKPGFGTRVLVFFLRIVPKVGPFSALDFKIPPPKAEDIFVQSVDDTVQSYRGLLGETKVGDLRLPDNDFDTGHETKAGEYALADKTYATLVSNLSDRDFKQVTPELRENILAYYADLNVTLATRRKPKEWAKLQADLEKLKAMPAPQPTITVMSPGNSDNRP